ncbi:MAG: hypothetical protein ACRD50_06700 [Candidatus Acidiferrales bacterium]
MPETIMKASSIRAGASAICANGFLLRAALAALLAAALALPGTVFGWNANADRLIANKAVDTLPDEMRPFFDANRQFIVQHVTDPVDAMAKNPTDAHNRFIHLDHYGVFPFVALPHDYKAAVSKFTRHSLETQGLLPWEIGFYSQKLTESFRAQNWQEVRKNAATLAFYVAEAHDPFNTTSNEDGRATGQSGADIRFNASLVDRYSLFFYIHPNEASYVNDPTEHAFDMCMSAHAWLENVLLADRRARQGLNDYTDEYYDRFYSQAGAVLVRQISDAATDVGSYWMTTWMYAGKPPLPSR